MNISMNKQSDEYYMGLALNEARKGLGRTSPNPCVGAVIVKNGEVIGIGYHEKAGTAHAEIHALNRAGIDAKNATMYVTLEPCNHTGRTPPCSHAVAAAGIKRVIIGMLDPNPLVDGMGAQYLRENGIEVSHGVLEDRCRELNRGFIKLITTSLPFVVMKAGVSLDGRLSYQPGCGGVITGSESHGKVHIMRDEADAILVGIGTIKADNPSLTTRLENYPGKDPVRVILDTNLSIDEQAQVLTLTSSAPTWIFCTDSVDQGKVDRLIKRGIVVHFVERQDTGLDLLNVLEVLAQSGCASILVEGGATIHGALLNAKLVDRVNLFYAPVFAGDQGVSLVNGVQVHGGKKQAITLAGVTTSRYGEDVLITGNVIYPE